jgi:ketopantoate reductase
MRITMIGSGYVGLVSGACLSDFGHNVICVDKAADKIAALEAGRMPIFEPGPRIWPPPLPGRMPSSSPWARRPVVATVMPI